MIDAPDLTLADVLAREAGPPHVAMARGLEPAIELVEPYCDPRGPWYCTDPSPLPEYVAKLPTESVPQEPVGQPRAPASGWGYPPFHNASSPVLGGVSAWGAVFGGGSTRETVETITESTEVIRETIRETIIREDCGCPEPDPAPIPLPATGLLLGVGLLILNTFRRRLLP